MELTCREYRLLFNAVTDAIYQLELIKANLVYVQQQAEEIVIRKADSEDVYPGVV